MSARAPRLPEPEASGHTSDLTPSERRIAAAVVAELRDLLQPPRYVSAQEVARNIGHRREWVYSNREALGVEYLNGRPRFILAVAIERAKAMDSGTPSRRPKRRRSRKRKPSSGRAPSRRSGTTPKSAPRKGAGDA